ncbi:PspC domain-containing protein [Microbacterium dauci]|uniref:PspC domain-containing protein n=1 Tax=Microbacterium dauci TaxID=3048008 RepID=A0ABT6ZCJ0_9MICO|nr:PspC domain-containing protein [Microbacterium sp. LX3-4]MDJ1113445.1 PspC domain-containing protein [Microbacterium sp. LX3-4]
MTNTTTAPPAPPRPHSATERFFAWVARFDLVRGYGWIGGVAAGIAARIGIDVLVVRGVLIVVGLFGFPVLFLYGVAWAVLPDAKERVPLRDALEGRLASAHAGIAAVLLLGLLPAPVGVLVGTAPWWLSGGGGWGVIGLLWTLFLVILTVAFLAIIVRAATRAGLTPSETAPRTASAAASDALAQPVDLGTTEHADATGTDAAGFAASVPSPSPERELDELEQWKAQHAAWRAQEDAWRREQQDIARVARDEARAERQAHAEEFAAEAAERRRMRRLTKPRTPAAYVGTTIGVAVIVGAVVGLGERIDVALARGAFAALAVIAAAMVVAGALRWRSGFLAFIAIVTLIVGVVATAVPVRDNLRIGSYAVSNLADATGSSDDTVRQLWGDLSVYLDPEGESGSLEIEKRAGTTWISVDPGVELRLTADIADSVGIWVNEDHSSDYFLGDDPRATTTTGADGRQRISATLVSGDRTTAVQTIDLSQDAGSIIIWITPPRGDAADRMGN